MVIVIKEVLSINQMMVTCREFMVSLQETLDHALNVLIINEIIRVEIIILLWKILNKYLKNLFINIKIILDIIIIKTIQIFKVNEEVTIQVIIRESTYYKLIIILFTYCF